MNDLISIYQQRLNLHDAKFEIIAHEDSIVAIVYKILTADDKFLILKICEKPHHYYNEVYFLQYFANKLPIAKIIQLVMPEPNVHGAILMECLPGEILNKQQLNTALAFEIGALAAKIHSHRTAEFGDLTDPSSNENDPRQYFAAKFAESFAECVGHLSPTILQKCRKYYDNNIDKLLSVDGPCIIHRDFRPGNILAQNGHVSGLIDWASARAGFAEDDLCSLDMGEWGTADSIKQAFLTGYASVRTVPNYAEIMPLLLLNRAIAVIGFTVKIGTWNNRDAAFYGRHKKIMEMVLEL